MVHLEGAFPKPTEETLFADEEFVDFDFVFVSDENQQIRVSVHKMVFANVSTVFRAMFCGALREKNEVEIVDSSADAFVEFKRFIYASQMDLSVENIADVMGLANKYQTAECFAICERYLEQHLPDNDAFLGFELAVLFNRAELKGKFEQKIGQQLETVIKSDRFVNCARETLKSLLEIKFLLCDAKRLFDACMKWAVKACENSKMATTMDNQRNQLGDCLFLIPFHVMEPKEISKCVSQYVGLFAQEELIELVQMTTHGPIALNKFKYKSDSPAQWGRQEIWDCFYWQVDDIQKYWVKQLEVTAIVAHSSNRLLGNIKLLEIRPASPKRNATGKVLYETLSGTLSIAAKVENGNEENGRVSLEQPLKILCCLYGTSPQIYVRLARQVLLEKNKKYELKLKFDSSWCDKRFYAVIPYPYRYNPRGLVHSIQTEYLD